MPAGDPKTTRVIRVDAGALRSPVRTPQGFLRVDGYVSRVGIYEYPDPSKPDGIRRELRPEDEVFKQRALDSYNGAPITDGHPPVEVTAKNVKQYEIGTAMAAGRRDGNHVATELLVKDAVGIGKVESGKQELSPGYALDLEEKPGVHPVFGRYDAIQRNIDINHIAIVDRARGGTAMRLRMDGHDVPVEITSSNSNNNDRSNAMADTDKTETTTAPAVNFNKDEALRALEAKRINLDAQVASLTAERDAAVKRAEVAQGRCDELDKQNKTMTAELETARAASETIAVKKQADRADAAEAKLIEMEGSYTARVAARAALINVCKPVLGPAFKMDSLSDDQLRRLVLKRVDASVDVSAAVSAERIEGRFDEAMARRDANASSLAQLGSAVLDAQQAATRKDEKKQPKWTQKLPNAVR